MKKVLAYILFANAGLLLASCGTSGDQGDSGAVPGTTQVAAAGSVMLPGAVIDANGWYHDWDAGMAAAREKGRPVLIDFYTDWCSWCKVMDEKTFADAKIKKQFADGWITIKIDAENAKKKGTYKDKTLTYREMTSAFGVDGFPTYLIIDKAGEPVDKVVGYVEKDKFTVVLDFMREEIYKQDENTQKKYMETHMPKTS
jgi:thioredoxin-related protein